MKLNWNKNWILMVNIISFCISLLDGYVWRNSNTGFPIFTVLGIYIAAAVVWIYKLYVAISSRKSIDEIAIEIIKLWFSAPFYGILGGMCGLIAGFTVFKF